MGEGEVVFSIITGCLVLILLLSSCLVHEPTLTFVSLSRGNGGIFTILVNRNNEPTTVKYKRLYDKIINDSIEIVPENVKGK